MGFDWTQYHQLARLLLNKPGATASEEAKQRSAISRAYYAAFNLAKEYILDVEGESALPRTKDDHYAVIQYFRHRQDQVSADIADHLKRLRDMRNDADYDMQMINPQRAADNALLRTYQLIGLLSKLKH